MLLKNYAEGSSCGGKLILYNQLICSNIFFKYTFFCHKIIAVGSTAFDVVLIGYKSFWTIIHYGLPAFSDNLCSMQCNGWSLTHLSTRNLQVPEFSCSNLFVSSLYMPWISISRFGLDLVHWSPYPIKEEEIESNSRGK